MKYHFHDSNFLGWATAQVQKRSPRDRTGSFVLTSKPEDMVSVSAPTKAKAEALFRKRFKGKVDAESLKDHVAEPWWLAHIFELADGSFTIDDPEKSTPSLHYGGGDPVLTASGAKLALFVHAAVALEEAGGEWQEDALDGLAKVVKNYRGKIEEKDLPKLAKKIVERWAWRERAASGR